jgi:L-amino acid N-acyltransferase YncA
VKEKIKFMINTENLSLRDATLEDLPFIVEIYNSTVAGRIVTADTEPVSVESRIKWFDDHSKDFRPIWVLEYNNVICGWVSFQSFYGRPAYNATVEISIYVHNDYRKNGLGRYLLSKAVEACPKLGIKTLLGFIFGHNAPSLNLFYQFGFTDWAVMPKIAELDGVERDLIIVGKRVS